MPDPGAMSARISFSRRADVCAGRFILIPFLLCRPRSRHALKARTHHGRTLIINSAIGCHTFRATGITDYLTNGGRIEVAQRMAGHSNAKTTGFYDRRNDDISVGEVERI